MGIRYLSKVRGAPARSELVNRQGSEGLLGIVEIHKTSMTKKLLDPMKMQARKERALIDTRALLQAREFESLEEANAYLQEVLKEGGPPPAPADTPLKQAQQVVYDAMEATGRRRVALARRALEISKDCADAWVLLAGEQNDLKKALEYARKGVAAGERALGEEYFKENEEHFWEDVDTRPYMRALLAYADLLWAIGDRDEAIDVYQKMLRLNPNDNQGVRHVLAYLFAEADRDDVFEELLETYDGDPMAAFRYAKALWLFRKSGAGPEADAALEEAMEGNPFVPQYLLTLRKLPARMPDYHGFGDRDEAVAYVSSARKGWRVTEGALAWLESRFKARLDQKPLSPAEPAKIRRMRK